MHNTKEDNRAHLYSIDNMRGIASFAVMFFHFIGDVDNEFLDGSLIETIAVYGNYGVHMFFIISGFIIPYTLYRSQYQLKDYGVFIIKRITRLDPPYLMTILIIIVLKYALGFFTPVQFSINWTQLLLHLGYLNTFFNYEWLSVVFWTLSVEFQYYILIGLIFPLFISNTLSRRASIFILLVISPIIVKLIPDISETFNRSLFIVYTPLFIMGIVAFQWYCKIISTKEFYIWIFMALAISFYFLSPVVCIVEIISLVLLFNLKIKNPILQFFGIISYSLYLLHGTIGGIIISMAKKRTDNFIVELIGAGVAMLISILAAYLLYKWVEKPSQKLSSSIKYQSKPVAI